MILVAHELAANAVEHGGTASRQVDVEVTIDEDDVFITVRSDRSSRHAVEGQARDPDAERGRGLAIVGALGEWWDTTTADAYAVTARISR